MSRRRTLLAVLELYGDGSRFDNLGVVEAFLAELHGFRQVPQPVGSPLSLRRVLPGAGAGIDLRVLPAVASVASARSKRRRLA